MEIEIKHDEYGMCSDECHLARYDRKDGICSCPASIYHDGDNPSQICPGPGFHKIVPTFVIDALNAIFLSMDADDGADIEPKYETAAAEQRKKAIELLTRVRNWMAESEKAKIEFEKLGTK